MKKRKWKSHFYESVGKINGRFFLKYFFFFRLIYDKFSFPINSYFFLLWFFIKRKCFPSESEAREEIETINKRQEMIVIRDYDAELFQDKYSTNFLQKIFFRFCCIWTLDKKLRRATRKRSIFITGCHVFFAPDSHIEKDEMKWSFVVLTF